MSRYARKVDSTHGAIRAALEAAGFSVWDTHANGGNGPDLVAGLRGATVLVECKSPTRRDGGIKPSSLSDGQRSFATTWRGGPYIVATDPHVAVLKAIEAITRRGQAA
jgi:Holliday junction resolvase